MAPSSDHTKRPRRPSSAAKVIAALATALTIIGALAALHFADLFHAVAFSVAAVIVVACCLKAGTNRLSDREDVAWLCAILTAAAVAAWAAQPAGPSKADGAHGSSGGVANLPLKATGPGAGHAVAESPAALFPTKRQVNIGGRPTSLTLSGGKLLVTNETAVTVVEPDKPSAPPKSFPIAGVFAVIKWRKRLLSVRDGGVSAYDMARDAMGIDPPPLGERPGCIARAFGSVYFCNTSHQKLEVLDPNRLIPAPKPIPLPGEPERTVVAFGYLFVSVVVSETQAAIVRIGPNGGYRVFETEPGPEALGGGTRYLLISHPGDRIVTRMNPHSGKEVGDPIPVEGGVIAIERLGKSIWALSNGPDMLERLDEASGKVSMKQQRYVPPNPTGLAAAAGRLFVLARGGLLTELRPIPAAPGVSP